MRARRRVQYRLDEVNGPLPGVRAPEFLLRGKELRFPRSGADRPVEEPCVRRRGQAVPSGTLVVGHTDRQFTRPADRTGHDGTVTYDRSPRLVTECSQSLDQCVETVTVEHRGVTMANHFGGDAFSAHGRPTCQSIRGWIARPFSVRIGAYETILHR